MINAILTDIEDTTTSIAFVFDVLFPYARDHMARFVAEHGGEAVVRTELRAVAEELGHSLDDDEVVEVLKRWIAEDRKATPLKNLQGMLWQRGYQQGDFTGHVHEDAVRNLRQWHAAGLRLYVYSSGSVQAQKTAVRLQRCR
uniref:2,3-diketo-5-methylthio-1-phosphopentane phosphatase n=1 Tax=Candidatus Kentrum sp. LFY TaxID=2126342 RepID=A0A450UM06_9GAMM|nr:MAG: 2,3-diketo-5-methylthio-1-phosphopentane phosphatase [Candidatus Kentron sp. LFY]